MDEELAHRLQVEEEAAEEACQGRDVATLEVVMEAVRPLACSQLEGLGLCTGQAHPEVGRLSSLPPAVVVQLPMVVG